MSCSRRQAGREWSLQDYAEQAEFWAEIPPPNISLMLIATAHGAKFKSPPKETTAADQEAELAQLLAMGSPVPVTR